MGNKRYDKLQASFEASQPQLPTDFTHRVMKRVESKSHRVIRMRHAIIAALAVAASSVFFVLLVIPNQAEPEKALAVTPHVPRSTRPTYIDTADLRTSTPTTHVARPVRTLRTQSSHLTDSEYAPDVLISTPHEDSSQMVPATLKEPHLHYATHVQTGDTVPYQDPARVDEFIAKLADYYNVKQGELQCSLTQDSCVASAVYVFPDLKEIDVFGRLLQVACWYSDETPGYHLNFSHRQFFFELKDMRKQLQYRWIAERVNGKILLYSTCAPIEVVVSSACYQEYLDELMHTKSINSKTLDI